MRLSPKGSKTDERYAREMAPIHSQKYVEMAFVYKALSMDVENLFCFIFLMQIIFKTLEIVTKTKTNRP